MAITFRVDEVEPVVVAHREARLASMVEEKINGRLIMCSDLEQPLIAGTTGNPLVAAVHLAFSEHRPLVISPDVVWLTIAQGFAQHVRNNAESLRPRFVRHQQKLELRVKVEHATTPEDWASIIRGFVDAIGDHVGRDLCRLVTYDFSTTNDAARLASHVTLMDAFVHYFDYICKIICGIPEITLLGEPSDWHEITRRVEVLAKYDLEWWTEWLIPICDQLERTAAGEVNRDFWQCIYMPEETYGDKLITGWVGRMFPYVRSAPGAFSDRNRTLAPRGTHPQPDFFHQAKQPARLTEERLRWLSDGLSADALPLGICRVPVRLEIMGTTPQTVELFAGLLGVAQDRGTDALWPHLGWGLLERPIFKVVNRIRREHEPLTLTANGSRSAAPDCLIDTGAPGELLALLSEIDGAVLFGGAYRLRPRSELAMAECPGTGVAGLRFCDLDDGTFLASVLAPYTHHEFWIVRGRSDGTLGPAQRCPVLAKRMAPFLEQLLDSGGARWFDGPGYQPQGMLSDALRRPAG